ncbi:DUF4432 family protein [bacterium]|nr:DUF4432 family protein [bacterium]
MTLDGGLTAGRLTNIDAVAQVRESIISSGPGAGMRAIDVQVWDGVACRIYPDRGLDIGQAWYRGVPLAWISQIGEAGPLHDLQGADWSTAFGGGLMTTCGLRNVGAPSEGHGLHGTYSHLPAADDTVERTLSDAGGTVTVRGVIDDPEPPAHFRVERTITFSIGTGRVEVEDVAANLGHEKAPAPLLYHLNFGYPLWAPPARLEIPVASTTARDTASEVALDTWHLPPDVAEQAERVLEHDLGPDLEWGNARISNPDLGIEVTIGWDRTSLPRLNQWLDPNPGMSVLGVEPANCSTRGRAFDRAAGIMPFLGPMERRVTRVCIEAGGM